MPGPLIDGRYLVDTVIGGGGTGTVYRARDQRTGGPVAVKLLHPGYTLDHEYTRRFRREAQTAAAINSPRVVRIFDQGTHEGAPYIVMELIEGETLAALQQRTGALPLAQALGISLEIARAVAAAHAAGVVHRDLKPQNVVLTDGQLKVLDFGIARTANDITITATGEYLGTPAYSAPERLTGAGDIRVDIYAIGVMLYEMLAGAPPFTAVTPLALLQRHATADPPPLPAEVPESAARIALRCLLKEPEQRYTTPQELVSALEASLHHLRLTAVIPWPARGAAPAPATDIGQETVILEPGEIPGNLPEQARRFIGRVEELRDLHRLLSGARLLTITGAGGAGKTRLALELARQAGPSFPDGVWLVELAPLSESSLVAQTVAAVLGVQPRPGQSPEDALVVHLVSRRLLLLLDNCDHLGDAPGKLAARLVASCPGVTLLATGRELFGAAGEVSHLVRSLATPATGRPGEEPAADLAAGDATALFLDRSGLQPDAAEAAAVITICQQLSGIPLAIELVAARVSPAATVATVAAALAERVRALTGRSGGVIPRDRVLDTVLDWSYDTLPVSEQALLRRLSVFAGGAVPAAAAAVCGEAGEDATATAAHLQVLVGLGLAQDLPAAAEPRFRMLEPVRQYAARRLVSAGEANATQRRHRDWYLAFSDDLNNGLFRSEQKRWLAQGEQEHDNLRAAIIWSAGEPAEAEAEMTLAANTRPFWSFRGYHEEGRRRLSAAARQGDGSASVPRARAWIGLGMLAMDQGDFAAAKEALSAGLAVARATGEDWWIGVALMQLGNVYGTQGDFNGAKPLWEESLEVRRRLNDRQGIANLTANLSIIEAKAGNFAVARGLLIEALALINESGDQLRAASTEINLANIETTLGDFDTARERYERIVALRRDIGDDVELGASLDDLGGVHHLVQQFAAARSRYEEALTLRQRLQDNHGLAASRQRLGALALDMGELAAARAELAEALAIATGIDARETLALAHLGLARLALVEGAPDEARKELAAALALNQQIGDLLGLLSCLDELAGVAVAEGRPARAATLLAAAQAERGRRGIHVPPVDTGRIATLTAAVEAALTPAELAAARVAGSALAMEAAIRLAQESA